MRSFTSFKVLGAFLLAALVVVGGMTFPVPAHAVTTTYEIEGSWTDGVTSPVKSGDLLASVWRYNINDADPAPQNPVQDNVTITFSARNAEFTVLPESCLSQGVDPTSEILDDGSTLVCNLGTRNHGTAELLVAGVQATGLANELISLDARIGDPETNEVSASLPELELNNPFAMDMKFDSGTPTMGPGDGDTQLHTFPWSLRHAPGANAGSSTVVYELQFSSANGELVTPGTAACSVQNRRNPGHPYSDSEHDADRTSPFPSSCTLTQVSSNRMRLTLNGIDYSKATVPKKDSTGTDLPTDWDVVAAGLLNVQFNYVSPTTISFTSNAPTYTSAIGETSVDLASNNANSRASTRGTWTGGWTLQYLNPPQQGTSWTDTFRTMAGQRVLALSASRQPTSAESQLQLCSILDTKYTTFKSAQVGTVANGVVTPFDGVSYEYFTGTGAGNIVNPGSTAYDPNAFRCDGTTGTAWQSTLPADLSTVKAIRATVPASAGVNSTLANLYVDSDVKSDVAVGQDIWFWTSYKYGTSNWYNPHRELTESAKPSSGTSTPGTRYPFAAAGRDILRTVAGDPKITKEIDQSMTRPGATVNFTLNYRVDAPVDITLDGTRIIDNLPAGLTYVPGSASVVPSSVAGQRLTWDLGPVETNTDYTILLSATVDDSALAGDTFTNTAEIQLGDVRKTDSAQTRIMDGGYTFLTKTAEQQQVPHDEGVAEGSWTVRLTSADTGVQTFTDTIDILPFNGDGRGTSFEGSYQLSGPVTAVSGARVFYTTADPATLKDDPADASNGSPGSTDNNSVGWTTTFTPDATAVRVIGPELRPAGFQEFTIDVVTDGASFEDMYVNRAEARASRTQLVMRTSGWFQVAAANSVMLKKYVQDSEGQWHDAQNVDDYPSFHNGDTARYRIVVTNTGDQILNNLQLSDDKVDLSNLNPLPEGLDDGAVIGELAPGEDNAVSFEYEMPVAGLTAGQSLVNNACVVPEDEAVDESCDPAGLLALPASLAWEKVNAADPADYLAGSEWELVRVDEAQNPNGDAMAVTDCVAEDDADCTGLDGNNEAGRFLITDLPDGTYRLTETRAPAGYVLSSEPRFIDVQGITELPEPIVNEQSEALTIPLTGGLGTSSVITGAGIAAGLAILLIALRRTAQRKPQASQ